MKRTYGTSPIKRSRRSNDQIASVKDALVEIVEAQAPATVRQVYYRAVSAGIIDKTEQAYKSVCRMLTDLRRSRRIPYSSIADNTRWMRKPDSYGGIDELLRDTASLYRRDLWRSKDDYVEVWLEKDALSGVLYPVTAEFDVPLMISRGFASLSFLHGAGETIEYNAQAGKRVTIFYLGDHDPSGVVIPQKIESTLREFAPSADLTFTRLAVLPWQIKSMNLPTRPTKKTDSRCKGFEGESVEVDAIEPEVLRSMVRVEIEGFFGADEINNLRLIEAKERDGLLKLARQAGAA